MKVLLINGSPHEKGCTAAALQEVAAALEHCGVEAQLFWIGNQPVRGCIGCGGCAKQGKGDCVFGEDGVNAALQIARECDGFVFGSPVHYASASGAATSFLDRLFYSGKGAFEFKPGAAVVSCRRAGSTAALDQLNKYFTISNMLLVGSQYWNMVHGNTPAEVRQDKEGMQTMRMLGRNMAWILGCIELGKAAGLPYPEKEKRQSTNFIR